MISGVSATLLARGPDWIRICAREGSPADEYAPDALGVLYGLGCVE